MSRRGVVGLLGLLALFGGLAAVPAVMFMTVVGGSTEEGVGGCPPAGSGTMTGASEHKSLDVQQLAHAATVVTEGQRLGVPRRAVLIALAVAHQESRFRNYANDGLGGDLYPSQHGIAASLSLPHDAVGTDHGSLGIFQQQWPWWGGMHDLMDPAAASRKFYGALLKVPGWEDMSLIEAGQAVQRSAFPDAYADDEPLAQTLLDELAGSMTWSSATTTSGAGTCDLTVAFSGRVVFPLPPDSGYVDQQSWGQTGAHWARGHTGTDFSVACGTPVLSATDGAVAIRTDQAWSGRWLVQVTTGPGQLATWYAHMQAVHVREGDQVQAGQVLGEVGSEGESTGCHLHFEVHPKGGSMYEDDVDPTKWLADNVGSSQPGITQVTQTAVEPTSLLTGNVPFTLSAERARKQIHWLLSEGPGILVLQEVTKRNVAAIVRQAPGNWGTWQPAGAQGGSAIVWNADQFRAVQTGVELGFRGAEYDRWMPWVVLKSSQGTVPIIALHMPTNSSKNVTMRGYYQTMTQSYQRLIATFHEAGLPPVVGGDWNHPLDRPRESWSPVPMLKAVGMTTNWRVDTPCSGTRGHGGRIDGFAFHPDSVQVLDQGCLERRRSDHRPVWIVVAPTS